MITLEQARALKYRQEIHHSSLKNTDGSCSRYRVNGKVKTWKGCPGLIDVPLKYGLYNYGYLTEHNLHLMHLPKDCPNKGGG